MIPEQEIKELRQKLKDSKKPLFLFDDDADGVSSFVMFYKLVGDGKGICIKGKPIVESNYYKKIEEYSPDKIFILDKPLVQQELLDKISQEVIWLDHHPAQNNKKVKYYNPRIHDPNDNRPTSYWAYQVCKQDMPELLWIAGIGVIGDWSLALKQELTDKYPDLLPPETNSEPHALFSTKLGLLVKIIDFNLKGTTTDVMKSIKILTRINDPYEILNQTSSKGKFLFKKYLKVNEKYEALKNNIEIKDDQIIFFKYSDNKLALSSMLSNELLFENPNKIIIIAREKTNELMISLRSTNINILPILNKALEGIDGYGGGHDNACGACVKSSDFDDFMNSFKKHLEETQTKR